jgi:hypothetical protein
MIKGPYLEGSILGDGSFIAVVGEGTSVPELHLVREHISTSAGTPCHQWFRDAPIPAGCEKGSRKPG